MSYETPLPYSAIDPDYAVCPIPLLERPGYTPSYRYLHREVRQIFDRQDENQFNDRLASIGCHSRHDGLEEHEQHRSICSLTSSNDVQCLVTTMVSSKWRNGDELFRPKITRADSKKKLLSLSFRTDPFASDILPTTVPPLLQQMPDADRQQVLEEYECSIREYSFISRCL